ncbi:MAG: hypothetical protein HQ528_07675 [Candidatus Marinimicrobia bacterium]|nr:hypothetical protein [Candidatus Neomarinimicrobiota bacterium]
MGKELKQKFKKKCKYKMAARKVNTIIVLGAGASKDIKFPTGVELLNAIAALYNNKIFLGNIKRILWNNQQKLFDNNLTDYLPSEILNKLHQGVIEYWTEDSFDISGWTDKLFSTESIDDFLYYRKEYSILAKLGAIAAISNNEIEDYFKPNEHGIITRTWYNDLWELIRYNCKNLSDIKQKLANLIIINFNYDRSFDYFLSSSIYNLFENEINEKLNLEELIPIFHVYGSIGSLLKDDENYTKYSPIKFREIPNWENKYKISSWNEYGFEPEDTGKLSKYDERLLKIALNIKTYNDSTVQSNVELFNKRTAEASHIYFFGFAYHEQNMSILFPKENKIEYNMKTVGGTCYKMSRPNINKSRQFLSNILKNGNQVEMQGIGSDYREKKISAFIQDYGIIL